MRYDVIIIGAGSAGCALATRLSEDPTRSVLLLEAGPDYPEFDHLPDDLKWSGNFLRSAFGPHNWGYVATTTPQQPTPTPCPVGRGPAAPAPSTPNSSSEASQRITTPGRPGAMRSGLSPRSSHISGS